ncbi:MAG: helix-turn-helix domain-containing protein [Acidobacteriota bacterium]
MARRREFDPEIALDRAMEQFWRSGYARTSVRDLVRETGVAHAGLYAAFGGKDGLFAAALDRYDERVVETVFGPLERPGAGRREIEALFQQVVDGVRSGSFRRGCLMATTAVEQAARDDAVGRRVRRNHRRQVAAFENALRVGVEVGTMRPDLDVAGTAHLLAAQFHGLSALARADVEVEAIERAAMAAIALLD